MTYNTGNPVPSTDPRDLSDNAGNLDKFANGDSPFYPDRLGRQRLSLAGMQQDFQNAQAGRALQFEADQSEREAEFQEFLAASGFSFVGDYEAGLTFTNRAQYTVRAGLSYRLAPTALLPYTTSGNWSIEQSNFALFPNEDVLRQDLADDQEPSSGAALVGYRGTDVATAISVAAPVNLQTVASIATAGLRAGARCSVNGTVFEISASSPRSSRYPLISAGAGLYAIPVENHTNNIIGTYVSKGGVVSASDWALANTRQQQGLEYDNRAGTVFLTSLVKPSSPEVGYLIEYAAAADGTIGAEVRRSGLLPMGHSDYFAVEYDPVDGKRYVWVGEESTSSLHRIEWQSGATAADIVQTISLSGIASGRCEISLYGADSLLLSFTRVDTGAITDHVCLLSDLAAGTFAPVWQQDVTPRLGAVVPIMPHQQRKHEGGLFAGLCGLLLGRRGYTFASVATAEGDVVGRGSYFDANAAASDEPEGLGWYWSSTHAKLLPVMTIWRPAGGVDLYGIAEPSGKLEFSLGAGQLNRKRWDTTGTGISQWGEIADGLEAQFPVGVRQLFVGGPNTYSGSDTFNPVNLRMTQVFDNATRQGGGIYAYGQANVLFFDGPNDLTYGAGLRWFGSTRAMMHVTEKGAFFGRAATLAEQAANKASLSGLGTAAYPVGVRGRTGNTAAAPCFLSEGGSLDYAVPSTEAMQLGGYDASAGTIATWMAINNTSIQPGADNTQSCGSPSLRWSVVYSGTGAINTSDAREKQQDRPLSEAEKAVAVRLKGMIKAFKFNDAVAAKGESARWHFGVIAQEVKAAFEAEGLVAERYAIICYDEWPEQPEVLPQPEKLDESGDVVEPAKPGKAYVAAGSRYGVRYEELLAFIISSL